MGNMSRILIVEDEVKLGNRLAQAFRDRGHSVSVAQTLSEGRQTLREFSPTHVVLDLKVGQESGLELVETAARKDGCRVVMLTGYGSVATALEAVRLGAVNYLSKPVTVSQLERALFGEPLSAAQPVDGPSGTPSLERVEWEHMHRVLRECSGNITHAANRLGIHRQALQRKLKKDAPRD